MVCINSFEILKPGHSKYRTSEMQKMNISITVIYNIYTEIRSIRSEKADAATSKEATNPENKLIRILLSVTLSTYLYNNILCYP